ncbi:MAG TPA: PDZ domain-containing protein [Pyrinomonadaceae bacterium]|jgi:membrane-associated protease RseP (regulator of RpoE activity)
MFRKSLFVFLLLISVCVLAFAQQSENRAEQKFAFVFGDEGGYLGVETQEVTKENFSKFGLSKVQGVVIEKVLENSPATQAGLQAGDVILKFNGEEATSIKKLTRLIGEVAPDHQATLTVLRGGSEREIVVTLGKRPPMGLFETGRFNMPIPFPNGQFPQLPPMTDVPQMRQIPVPGDQPNVFVFRNGGRQIGVAAQSLTKQLAEYFGVDEGKGLLISSVRENSPAARAGLKAGDVIVEAEGREIKSDIDLIRLINEKKEGDISLTIIRDKNRQTVSVMPEASKDEMKPFENFIKPGDLPQMNFQPMPKMEAMPALPSMPIAPPTRVL